MEQEYSTLKILFEKGDKSYKLKKFPIYVGSGNAPNMIRLPGDGIDSKHGVFLVQKNNLVYEDLSTMGTKIRGTIRKKEKVVLAHGVNELQIGRYRIVVNNKYSIDRSLEIKKKKQQRKLYTILGSIAGLLLFLITAFFIYLNFIRPPTEVVISDFVITPNPLNYYDEVKFSSVSFEAKDELNRTEIGGTLIIEKNNKNVDSIKFSNLKSFQEKNINLPDGLLDDNKNDETIYVSLKLFGDDFKFLPSTIKKPFVISQRKQVLQKENIILTTNITGYLLDYKIEDPSQMIANYEVLLGDGRRLGPLTNLQSAISYYTEGEYNFLIRAKLSDGRNLEFQRKVIVD